MTFRDRALIAAFSLLFVAASIFALAPSLASTPTSGGPSGSVAASRRYVEGVLGHATNASPFGARSSADRDLVALVFRGLVKLGPNQQIVGDLASSWDVDPTGGQWTFHLRPGLTWQDGQPLTADDVVFTMTALADPAYTGPSATSWSEVTASAVDPLTVTLKLATPLGGFLQAATQAIAPKHLLGDVPPAALADDPFGVHPVGSGPFRLVQLDSRHAILDAVPGYQGATSSAGPFESLQPSLTPSARSSSPGGSPAARATAAPRSSPRPSPVRSPAPATSAPATGSPGPSFVPIGQQTPGPLASGGSPSASPGVPGLAGIEFRYFDDVATLRSAWLAGQLDGASDLLPSDAAALATTKGARILRYPSSTLMAVVLNLRAGQTPFGDPAVRKALLEAIDRQAVLADPLVGFGAVADSLIPAWSTMFDASTAVPVPFDPSAAKAALAAAGWRQTPTSWIPKGATAPLQFTVLSVDADSNPIAAAMADDVVAAWRGIGLDVIHQALPAQALLADHLEPGAYQAAVLPLVIGLDPDLYPLLASTQTRTGGANVAGVQDATLDRLLEGARAPGSDAARVEAYAALQERLASQLYILPLAFRDEVVVVRDTLSGPFPRAVGGPGDRFWDVLTWRLADSPAPS